MNAQSREPRHTEDPIVREDRSRDPQAPDPVRTGDELVIPVVAEELEVEKEQVRSTVRIHTRIDAREEVVDLPHADEEIVIEHVPVNTIVTGEVPTPHQEGDVLVIPVLEEVAVVETRLMLRELVRVSKRRTVTHTPQHVTLRRSRVEIERAGAADESQSEPSASRSRDTSKS